MPEQGPRRQLASAAAPLRWSQGADKAEGAGEVVGYATQPESQIGRAASRPESIIAPIY